MIKLINDENKKKIGSVVSEINVNKPINAAVDFR